MNTMTIELPVEGLPSPAGMERVEFLLAASRDGVPVVDMTDEEMAAEFAA